jgi:hypothetical protein
MLSFVKQSVLVTDFGHVKVVCQKDNGEFLHKSFFDITFFHGSFESNKSNLFNSYQSSKSNLLIYGSKSGILFISS